MKKIIKVIKIAQAGRGINIPKPIAEIMELNLGDSVEVEFDVKKKCIIIKKKEKDNK